MRAGGPRWTLAVAILGSGIAFLDATIVEAYSLMLASLVLVGGALGDRLGRKRVYLAGVMLFALASVVCGLAPDALVLVAARAVQGVGAALLVPGSLSLISAAYDDTTRGAAIGTWSAFSAITGAVGPIAGGWVVTHASWRWLFFFNVPLAAAVVVLSRLHVVETRDDEAPATMDWAGAALATLGLGLVVYALVDSADAAGARRVIPMLAVGLVTLVAFVVVEARGRAPMVHLSLFRSRTFSGTNLLTLLLYAALGGAFFFLPFDLIQVQGYSPAKAGAALLPFVLLVAGMSRAMGALVTRLGARRCSSRARWRRRRVSRFLRDRPPAARTGARSFRPSSCWAWAWGSRWRRSPRRSWAPWTSGTRASRRGSTTPSLEPQGCSRSPRSACCSRPASTPSSTPRSQPWRHRPR